MIDSTLREANLIRCNCFSDSRKKRFGFLRCRQVRTAYQRIGLTDRFHLLAELGGTTTFKDFDGYGASDQFGDNLVGLTAGISFTIGKVGWRKVIDPVPYIRQNEELAVHALCLAGKNRGLQKNNAMNLAIIAELKKILELEGLLDRYADKLSELVGNAESQTASSGYPRNNYSGLNSLRARLMSCEVSVRWPVFRTKKK